MNKLLVIGAFLLLAALAAMIGNYDGAQTRASAHKSARAQSADPYLQAADSARAARESKLSPTARWAVNSATDDGIVRDESGPNFVVVGPQFYVMDFQLKSTLCAALAIVRAERGLTRDFALIESINNRAVGTYVRGVLEMN